MNVGSKHPIARNNSGHVPAWPFYFPSRMEQTGSPGVICMVCHQVLCHPSEHGTSSMRKHVLAKAHIAKLNEITESDVSELTTTTIDETALAILKRQGCRGITIVSSQRKSKFDHLIVPMSIPLTDTMLQTGSKGLCILTFTKTPGIATSCYDVFWLVFLGTLYQTSSYGGHIMHYAAILCFHQPAPLATFP